MLSQIFQFSGVCLEMKTILAILLIHLTLPLSTAEPALADLLPGVWRGMHTSGTCGFQHIITVQKQGNGFIGKSVTWSGITEEQALAAVKGQRPKTEFPKAVCVQQQFTITLEGDVVTFKGTTVQETLALRKYAANVFSGKLVAPGIVGGASGDAQRTVSGIFHLWREDALKQRPALEVAKGQVLNMDCMDGGKYHYTCYVPQNYDPEKATPVLINFAPNGNAQPLSPKLAEETGWIMAGLTESKNGPVGPSYENRDAVLFDLQRRFKVDMKHVYFSGFSGGAWCASESSLQYPGVCAGLILMGAYFGAGPPPDNVPIFFITGEKDMNRKEVEAAYAAAQKVGRSVSMILHPGGHELGRAEDHEAAIRWLAKLVSGKAEPGKK
jgi:dienelactone hydrolase